MRNSLKCWFKHPLPYTTLQCPLLTTSIASIIPLKYNLGAQLRATLHTRRKARDGVTVTLQALSLVEKAEPVQVCFTLRLRDQRSM
jgi:hypothetical protein